MKAPASCPAASADRIRSTEGCHEGAEDLAYKHAKTNTPHMARTAQDPALGKVMQLVLKDASEVHKQFVENGSFRRFIEDMAYHMTND